MWTEMINAAGRIRGFASPNRICVDTVIRASRRGQRRGEVDIGWLSVARQRSVCEKCAGRLRYLGHVEFMVQRLREPLRVPYPNAVDEMTKRTIALTPGSMAGFGGRAESGTEYKVQERMVCQYLYDSTGQSPSVREPCRLARCAAPFGRVRRGYNEEDCRSRLCVGLTFTEYHALLASASDQSFTAANIIVPDTTQSVDVAAKAAFSDHIGYPA